MVERKFGRFYVEDNRDKKFRIQKVAPIRTSRTYSSRWFGDQKNTSECVGYSLSHLLECSPYKQWLNPSGIYDFAQLIDEWDGEYDGTSVRAGLKVLQKLGFIKEYRWGKTLNDAVNSVLEVGPIIIGVNWYVDMMETDGKGFIHVGGENLGGHAILVDGVYVKTEKFRLKNSWSDEWGKEGRCYLSFKDFSRLMKEEGEIGLVIEQTAKPTY